MKNYLALLAIALLFAIPAYSQFEVQGKITGELDEALAGATVRLVDTHHAGATDAHGVFQFRDVQEGSYFMEVRFLGYHTLTKRIRVNKSLTLTIRLKPDQLISDAVVVKGTRASEKDPVVYSQLAASDLNTGSRTQDIPYLLEMTPSLVATSDAGTGIGYTGLRIRGTDPSRINVTVNGIPYNDSESHDVYWVDMPDLVSSVSSIQIQRGIGTSTNGAAAFGANINIQTQVLKPEPYADWHVSAGSFNTFKNTVSAGTGLLSGHFAVDFRVSNLKSDGYIDRAFANMNSAFISAGWYTEKSILKATVFTGKELTYQAWGGVPAELLATNRTYNPYTYANEVDDYKQNHIQLHWSYHLMKNLNLNVALHNTRGSGFYEQFKEDQAFNDYLMDPVIIGGDTISTTHLVRRKWLDNNFFGGVYSVDYSSDKIDLQLGGGWNQYDGDHFGRIIWAQYASNSNPDENYYFSNGLKRDWSNYLKINYSVRKNGHLFADLQYRNISYRIKGEDDDQRILDQEHLYNFFNPKTGIVVDLSANQRVYASVGVGNREPKRSNFTDARPDQQVKPEKMVDFEGGYSLKLNQFRSSANIYYMNYKDQLVLTGEINDVGSPIMVNVEQSYRAGIELECAWKPLENLDFMANATLSSNKIGSFEEFVDDWDTWGQKSQILDNTDLAFSPRLIAAGRIGWNPMDQLNLQWNSKFVGDQFIDNSSSAERKLDSYFVNDVILSWSRAVGTIKMLRVFFQINNIFNHLYESNAWVYSYYYEGTRNQMIGYYPQAGRNFMMGLNLSL